MILKNKTCRGKEKKKKSAKEQTKLYCTYRSLYSVLTHDKSVFTSLPNSLSVYFIITSWKEFPWCPSSINLLSRPPTAHPPLQLATHAAVGRQQTSRGHTLNKLTTHRHVQNCRAKSCRYALLAPLPTHSSLTVPGVKPHRRSIAARLSLLPRSPY